MFKDVPFDEYAPKTIQQLPKGAFLTVKDGERVNTMTIGWGNIGVIWGKPVFTVLVRLSRYTYELLKNAREFTVSIPASGDLQKELGFCGSKSGRDFNKFQECGLTPIAGKAVAAPIIKECAIFYEGRVVYHQAMDPALTDEDIQNKFYSTKDYHVFFYGEILASYIRE